MIAGSVLLRRSLRKVSQNRLGCRASKRAWHLGWENFRVGNQPSQDVGGLLFQRITQLCPILHPPCAVSKRADNFSAPLQRRNGLPPSLDAICAYRPSILSLMCPASWRMVSTDTFGFSTSSATAERRHLFLPRIFSAAIHDPKAVEKPSGFGFQAGAGGRLSERLTVRSRFPVSSHLCWA